MILRVDHNDLGRWYGIAGYPIDIDDRELNYQRVVDMIDKMKVALVGLYEFQLAFFGAEIGDLECNGVTTDGIGWLDLVKPCANSQEGTVGKLAAIAELEVDSQIFVRLNGIV